MSERKKRIPSTAVVCCLFTTFRAVTDEENYHATLDWWRGSDAPSTSVKKHYSLVKGINGVNHPVEQDCIRLQAHGQSIMESVSIHTPTLRTSPMKRL
jgi:hypothetical protein